MAKLELIPEIAQFKDINLINQKMKIISRLYFIDQYGNVYMHSLVPFIEKFAILNDDMRNKIPVYLNSYYLPNEFFDFSKIIKKSKLTFSELNGDYKLGQDDSDVQLVLHRGPNFPENTDKEYAQYINENFIKHFYTKYDLLLKYSQSNDFVPIDNKLVEELSNNQCIYYELNDSMITITKNLFMDIKKENGLSVLVADEIQSGFNKKRYVIYKLINEIMTTFTITAYIMY